MCLLCYIDASHALEPEVYDEAACVVVYLADRHRRSVKE